VSSEAIPSSGTAQRALAGVVAARRSLLGVRPLYVLSTLVVLQWILVAALAVTVRHNGWIYYMGGDQLWHYTGAYLTAHGQLAPTYVGIGWSTILAPITWFAGPNLVSALPAIILFNTIVLLPAGVVAMYGIGERIAGRLFGYWVALLWIVIPFIGIPYALKGYHQKWTEITMPQLLGLGAMSDYPSMIALVVGAYFCLRAVERGGWLNGATAGFFVGYAFAIKPSNFVFIFVPAVLFLVWRVRASISFAIGLAPCLAALGVWKITGQGGLPWRTTTPAERVAFGPSGFAHRYLRGNSWTQLHDNLIQLREFLWSDRLLEFIVVAGIVALLVRNRRAGAFVGLWFVTFLLLKGTYVNSRVEDATFWRLMMPAFPAFVLLAASLPLLVPGIRARPVPAPSLRFSRRLVLVTGACLVAALSIFPIALVAAAKPIHGPNPDAFVLNATLVPTSNSFAPAVNVGARGVQLRWRPLSSRGGKLTYTIYRGGAASDVVCGPVAHAPDFCTMLATRVGTTRTTSFVDRNAPRGTWTYRIGATANWLDDPQAGDVYVFSKGLRATAP
jgi:hypothetical protein